MTIYIWFGLMMTLSIAWIVFYLRRPLPDNGLDLQSSNIELGKHKSKELKSDLDQGLIDASQFEKAQDELATTLAMELEQNKSNAPKSERIGLIGWFSVILFLPILSTYTYQELSGFSPEKDRVQQARVELDMDGRIAKIEDYLRDNKGDSEAWRMLGLGYFEIGKSRESIDAYAQALKLSPKNSSLLTEYAYTLISSGDQEGKPSPLRLINRALESDPNNVDALYLSGMFEATAGDYVSARILWNRALSYIAVETPMAKNIKSMLENIDPQAAKSPKKDSSIKVILSVPKKIIEGRNGDDYLMVYAKPSKGRPMPIAIKKIKLVDYRGFITLSDMDSVMPSNLLSQNDNVFIVARISTTGNAVRQPGDLQVTSKLIRVGIDERVSLSIK